MATYVYGTYQKKTSGAGGASFRAFLAYTMSQTNSTYSLTLFAGLQCNTGNDIGTSGFSISVTGTGQTTKSKTNQTYYTNQADSSHRKTLISSWTWTWDKTTSTQSKTVACTVSASSMSASTATYTFTVPIITQDKEEYTITFNANGGISGPTTQTKIEDTSLTLTSYQPTKPYYKFVCWNTNASGTGTNYYSGSQYTANAAATLYAKWAQISYPNSVAERAINKITYGGNTYNLGKEHSFYAKCTTAAATAQKEITLSNLTSFSNGDILMVDFANSVPANATIKANSLTAIPIYYRGSALSDATLIQSGDRASFMYSDTSPVKFHLFNINNVDNSGDRENTTFVYYEELNVAGLLANSKKSLYFNILLPKPLPSNWTANDISVEGSIRAYCRGSILSKTDLSNLSSFTFTLEDNNTRLYCIATVSSAPSGGTNYDLADITLFDLIIEEKFSDE